MAGRVERVGAGYARGVSTRMLLILSLLCGLLILGAFAVQVAISL